ncbi:MAG: DNA replication complex GINS family protein [Nitrososphaeria archaeon]|nr:DNA replication complex GINS family protein [Nitrososphaeria archaeon]
MSVQTVVEEFRQALRRVEVGFLNSLDEVTMVRDLPKLSLPSGVFENIRAGANIRVHRWIAEKLVERELAKPVSGAMDLKLILQLRWREKSIQAELQPLPEYFYLKTGEALSGDHEIIPHLKDIYSLRLSKIMSFAAKRVPRSMVENLTAEEKILYDCLLGIVNAWYEFIEGGKRDER